MRKPVTVVAEEFIAASRHSWPGDVRELQNFAERSVILSERPVLNDPLYRISPAPVTLEQAQRSHTVQTLKQTDGGPNGAAARIGLRRTTLDLEDSAAGNQSWANLSVAGATGE